MGGGARVSARVRVLKTAVERKESHRRGAESELSTCASSSDFDLSLSRRRYTTQNPLPSQIPIRSITRNWGILEFFYGDREGREVPLQDVVGLVILSAKAVEANSSSMLQCIMHDYVYLSNRVGNIGTGFGERADSCGRAHPPFVALRRVSAVRDGYLTVDRGRPHARRFGGISLGLSE